MAYHEIYYFDLTPEEQGWLESYKWEMVKHEFPVPVIDKIFRADDGSITVEYTDGEELTFQDGERW